METLSNDTLIFSYLRAKELQLDDNFLDLLLEEINKRKLEIDQICTATPQQ